MAIEDMVEKRSKVSTPAVPGALFSGMGQGSKKGKGLIRGNSVNSSPAKYCCELTEHEVIAVDCVFFPNLPGDTPGKP